MKTLCFLLIATVALSQSVTTSPESAARNVTTLLAVKRIYVSPLTGGAGAQSLRDLIIAGINSTGLFVLTDNPEHADAVLKGAADDHTFEDTFDSNEGLSTRDTAGKYGSGGQYSRIGGGYAALGSSQNESRHIKERKHEAYASVRLCANNGDVLWSTTQESMGAKFRGASADVATKVAHQLSLDFEHLAHSATAAK